MFQIVNNKVLITRGQSAVYSREVRRNDDDKSPYVLPNWCDVDSDGNLGYLQEDGTFSGIRFPKLRFSVKKNIYSTERLLDYYSDIIPDTATVVDVAKNESGQYYTLKDGNKFLDVAPENGKLYFVRTGGDYVGQIFKYDSTTTSYSQIMDYLPLFMTQEIQTYVEGTTTPKFDRLFKQKIGDSYKYFYFYHKVDSGNNANGSQVYHCVMNIPIGAGDTINIAPGTYYYEISLIYKENDEITYKEVLLEPTEFIIGGSNVND